MREIVIGLAELSQDDGASGVERKPDFPVRGGDGVEIAEIEGEGGSGLGSQSERLRVEVQAARAFLRGRATLREILEFSLEVGHAGQAVLFPHSGQNFVPASNFVPQRVHSFFGRSDLPHSGQNFAPWVRAPQAGQNAAASLVRSRSLVKS